MKYILYLYSLLSFITVTAQRPGRTVTSINEHWQFSKRGYTPGDTANDKKMDWQPVSLPHTWNTLDVMDDEPGYYRGAGWYRKTLRITEQLKEQSLSLQFEGAGQHAVVFINGKKAGEHTGGYSAFNIVLNPYLRWGNTVNENEIVVKVDNSFNKNIPPLTADFTFYGGLYREVFLVKTNPVHFASKHGATELYLTTPAVSKEKATVSIKGTLNNTTAAKKKIQLVSTVYDEQGMAVAEIKSELLLQAAGETLFQQEIKNISKPLLWSPERPYLYRVLTRIVDKVSGLLLDEVQQPLGFRWFRFDAANGFFLNDQPYKLVGASRHQDYPGKGNAVPDELAREDVALLKKMGGNFLRVAHYPQDPAVLEACDRLGILASVEIPVVNEITETDSFYRNCENMLVEMIRQQYNHPSVIIWCYMNEVLLRPQFNNDKPRQQVYFSAVTKLARRLDSIARKEDPARYTMIANHGDFAKYKAAELTDIPMLVGWNLYSGWYGGSLPDFASFLDRHRASLPEKPLLVTEYGADADPRIHSFNPVRFDKSVEYTTRFHQYYLAEMLKRPFVAAAMVWNLADFNSETREETMPHINNKGLLRTDRTAKDPYYFYQSQLQKEPFLKIGSPDWTIRSGVADSAALICVQPVQVISNLDSVVLFLNGKKQTTQKVNDGIATWLVPFVNGRNTLLVKGEKGDQPICDQLTIDFRLLPRRLTDERVPFQQINILLGASRYYIDEERKQLWIPDQGYSTGGWGSIGGKAFKITGNSRLPYGTDKNIKATAHDPVYQTQQTGIEAYRLDVPAGEYEISFHFAELLGGMVKELAYNLSSGDRKETAAQRVFDVYVNERPVIEELNIAEQYGMATAVQKKIRVTVKNKEGIHIRFNAREGEPVLNALQVVKLY